MKKKSILFPHFLRFFKMQAILVLLLAMGFAFGQTQTVTINTTGNGSWTVPPNVSSITVEAWGGGGGGGGSNSNGNRGSGGGSGGYSTITFTVASGDVISYTVGGAGAAGGSGNNAVGGTGGATSILTLTANGGTGGARNNGTVGAGGTATGGTTNTTGNPGILGNTTINGGYGGNAPAGGGTGGTGSTNAVGGTGTAPGGGGGGGERTGGISGSDYNGGAGGSGGIKITYAPTPSYRAQIISANTGSPTWCAGETRNVTVTITNTGSKPWTDVAEGDNFNIGVKWNTNGSSWNDYNVRVDAQNLAPGATATYTLPITASTNVGGVYGNELPYGTNNLTFDVVYEGKFWFGNNNGGGGPGNSVLMTPNQTILRVPKTYTIQQAVSPAGTDACSQDYVKLDIAGMPPAVPFEENVTPLSNNWTKFGLATGTNYYAVDMVISNTNLAGGDLGEFQFIRTGNGYNNDWYIVPNSGLPENYLSISLDGYTSANLTFKSAFSARNNNNARNIYMDISTDAVNWNTLWSTLNIGNNANITATPTVDLSFYAGSAVYIRFRYSGDSSGLNTWSIDNIKINGAAPPVVWSPNTGLYTDAALTIPYTGGNVTSVYAAPNGSQLYTLSTNISPCAKSTASTIVHNKKKFTATTGNWSVNNNWFPVGSPLSPSYAGDRCIYIPNGKRAVVDIANAIAKNITVESGGKIEIAGNLTVTDFIKNESANPTDFIVKSDGNLIQINPSQTINTTPIAVRRLHSLTPAAANGTRKEYNFLSSPVANQNMKMIYGDNAANVSFVTKLNEATNMFVNATVADYAEKGRGFAVKEPKVYTPAAGLTASEAEYKNIPNNGDITVNLNWTAPGRGYNVVGNPYPSNVDIIDLYANSTQSLIDPTFRFWDNKVNDIYVQMGGAYQGYSYAIFNALTDTDGFGVAAPGKGGSDEEGNPYPAGDKIPNRVIKVSQAFMVRALGAGAQLNFTNQQRKTTSGTDFFGKESTKNRYRLQLVKSDGFTVQNGIAYFAAGNNAFGREDSRIPNSQASDALFTFASDAKVVINGKSSFTTDDVVNLGLRHFIAGTYKIEAVDEEGVFANGQPIYLKDKLLGILTDLTSGAYTFTSESGEFTNRFEIVYKEDVVLATDGIKKSKIEVYRDATDFVVRSKEQPINNVEVYDAAGRLMLTMKGNAKELRFSSDRLVEGMYVLKAVLKDGEQLTKKIRK